MSGRETLRLLGALLLGAALAFPAGMMIAGRDEVAGTPAQHSQGAAVRNVFSPRVRSDPYFLDQQRKNVEALELHCRETGESCAEARAARRWLEDAAKGR